MTLIVSAAIERWEGNAPDSGMRQSIEHGGVVVCPRLAFALDERERAVFDRPITDEKRKSVYLRAGDADLSGTIARGIERTRLAAMIERYAAHCHRLIDELFPGYAAKRHATGTSFRPRAIGDLASGRAMSWRKDDTRLHVDAFPSNPTNGSRILRVFTNVHPGNVPRVWRVGEPFADMARRFLPQTRRPIPGAAHLLRGLRITKRVRSDYDHLMLQLHDLAKADLDYQHESPQRTIDFMPGTTWICFSDQVMHAAMSGQYLLEQTWRLPLSAMAAPEASPMRVLESLTGRRLVR